MRFRSCLDHPQPCPAADKAPLEVPEVHWSHRQLAHSLKSFVRSVRGKLGDFVRNERVATKAKAKGNSFVAHHPNSKGKKKEKREEDEQRESAGTSMLKVGPTVSVFWIKFNCCCPQRFTVKHV